MYIASLPWYDLPEIRGATDLFWASLAGNLRARGFSGVPDALDRATPHCEQWTSGRLLFSQACGYDCLLPYSAHLQMIATPVYGAPGCSGPRYNSFVVISEDSSAKRFEDLHGARCVVNEMTSHSGMNALRGLMAPLHQGGRFFSEVAISGSHVASLATVAAGAADVAAIDCVTYELLRRYRPESLRGVRILGECAPMPAPPYVAGTQLDGAEAQGVMEALAETLQDPALNSALDVMLIEGVERLPLSAYEPIAALEQDALRCGYFEIETATEACWTAHRLAAAVPGGALR